ncbi:MAG: ABC transporter ATP-binding protein, partial [Verrucomicrobiota bacterium]
ISQRKPAVNGVSLQVNESELVALVGASGSGKTTLLRMAAGLEIPDSGSIFINEDPVFDERHLVPPEKRGVGLVFQDYALFPHLTLEKNIAYGLHQLPRSQRRERVSWALQLVGLNGLEKRFPHQLSGGQQQRVALARALAPQPAILLLDEPFSNLDDNLKVQVRDELRDILIQAGTTALFVTHDTKDAMCVAHKIAVLREGSVQQIGTPEAIYRCPFNEYTARFFGKVNRVPAELCGGNPDDPPAWIRPEDFEVVASPNDAGSDCFEGQLKKLTFLGEFRELVLICNGIGKPEAEISVKVDAEFHAVPGTTVYLRPKDRKLPGLS